MSGPPPNRHGRERTPLSLERRSPRRLPGKRLLLLASEPALSYLEEYIAHLGMAANTLLAPMTPAMAVAECRERLQTAGPFWRAFLIMEWDGDPAAPIHQAWREIQADTEIEGVRFLCCRPSFLLWILLHFEDPGAEAAQAAWLEQRVAHLLADRQGSLFARTRHLLDDALQRSQRLTRERLARQPRGTLLPAEPGSELHELIVLLRKSAR
ncbi:MAG: hypothetical protein HQL96_15100 [Magnetococcales bacterium]|nr:hypothetical protein [Magnetococcales bacterium]